MFAFCFCFSFFPYLMTILKNKEESIKVIKDVDTFSYKLL